MYETRVVIDKKTNIPIDSFRSFFNLQTDGLIILSSTGQAKHYKVYINAANEAKSVKILEPVLEVEIEPPYFGEKPEFSGKIHSIKVNMEDPSNK